MAKEEVEYMEAELVPIDDIEELSEIEYNKRKKAIAVKRNQVSLILDGKKLEHSLRVISNMDIVLDRIAEASDPEAVNAMDLKALTESYNNLCKSLNMIGRLDTVDTRGTPARIDISVEYY